MSTWCIFYKSRSQSELSDSEHHPSSFITGSCPSLGFLWGQEPYPILWPCYLPSKIKWVTYSFTNECLCKEWRKSIINMPLTGGLTWLHSAAFRAVANMCNCSSTCMFCIFEFTYLLTVISLQNQYYFQVIHKHLHVQSCKKNGVTPCTDSHMRSARSCLPSWLSSHTVN